MQCLINRGPILSFSITDFQTAPPSQNDNRHYFEAIAATLKPNDNFYQFTEKSLGQMRQGYRSGLTLTVNHDKYHSVGLGETSDAAIENAKLYVQAYIKKGLTFPEGPLGTSEQYIDSILDGFLKNVSVSVVPLKLTCSICGNDYRDYESCRHIRGMEYVIGEGSNRRVKTAIVIIEEAKARELSLVQVGADPQASIVKKAVNLYHDGAIDKDKLEAIAAHESENTDLSMLNEKFHLINSSADLSDPPDSNQADQTTSPSQGGNTVDPKDIAQLKAENDSFKVENASLKGELGSIKTECTSLRNENSALRNDAEKLKRDHATLTGANEELKTDKSTLQSENSALKTEIDGLKTESATLKTTNSTQKAQAATQETTIETLNAKVESFEQNKEILSTQLKESQTREEELNAEIAKLNAQIESEAALVEAGKTTRKVKEERYVQQYVRYRGEDCSSIERDRQIEFAKTQTIEQLDLMTASYKEAADAKFAPTRKTVEDDDDDTNTDNDVGPALGVGYDV